MFELTQAFLFFLMAQISSIVFSFGRAKALAAFCGVAGLGLISQGTNLIAAIQVFLGGGLTSGFVKLIAEYSKEDDSLKLNQVISSMFYFGAILGVMSFIIVGLFSTQISTYVFGNPKYSTFVLVCTVAACFVFQHLFFLNLFRGLLEWKTYSLTYILGYAANLIITVSLIVLFNISGAIWALLVSQIGNLLISIYIYQHVVKPRHKVSFVSTKPALDVVSVILRIIGPLVVLQIIASLCNLAISSLIIGRLGVDQNGIYRVASGISDGYMGLILAFQFSYVLPKIAGTVKNDPQAARKTQNDGLRICLLVFTPFLIALLAARELWIPILYSRAFLAAQGILGIQFLGDFFLVIRKSLNVDLVPTNRLKYYTLDGLLLQSGTILLSAVFLPNFHLIAVVSAGTIMNVLLTLLSFVYHSQRTTFRLSFDNKKLLVKAFLLFGCGFAVAILIPNLFMRGLVIAGILVLMLVFLPRKGELSGLAREFTLVFSKSKRVTETPD